MSEWGNVGDVDKLVEKVYHTKELQKILNDVIQDFIEQVVLLSDDELKEDRSEWLKKYGDHKDYVLQCAIASPFIKEEDFKKNVNQILDGKNYFNINFLGMMQKNSLYNDFLNSGNIIIGMSGAEGWGLPEFQSVALGKHAVILNATAYKEWATEKNCVLVEPNGKEEAADECFLKKEELLIKGTFIPSRRRLLSRGAKKP